MWDHSFPAGDWTLYPCTGRGSLDHWTPGEAPWHSCLHTQTHTCVRTGTGRRSESSGRPSSRTEDSGFQCTHFSLAGKPTPHVICLQSGPGPHLSVRKRTGLASPKFNSLTGVGKFSLVLHVYWYIFCLYNFIHVQNKISCLLWKHNLLTTHKDLVRRPCPCESEEWRRAGGLLLRFVFYTHMWLFPAEHTRILCHMYLL